MPIPPINEQLRIVSKIKELLEKINYLKQNILNLDNEIGLVRNKLINLAIQGQLVAQDPQDEPANLLLDKINAEKAQLIINGDLKDVKNSSRIYRSDDGSWYEIANNTNPVCINKLIKFDVPKGWGVARLSQISLDSADGPFGSNLKKEHYTDKREVRIIQLSNIGDMGWKDSNEKYTTFDYLPNISRSEAFPGDIIIAKMMPAGRAIICPDKDEKYVLSSDAVRFNFSSKLDKKFLFYAINSDIFKTQVYSEVQGITRVRTSLNKLRNYILPIPPINEQRRIVDKIEKLYSLLDSIKNELDLKQVV